MNIFNFDKLFFTIDTRITSIISHLGEASQNLYARITTGTKVSPNDDELFQDYASKWLMYKVEADNDLIYIQRTLSKATITSLYDASWRSDTDTKFNNLFVSTKKLADLPCPKKAKSACDLTQQALVTVIVAQSNFNNGMNEINPDQIEIFVRDIEDYKNMMADATSIIVNIKILGK
jgi:hypothetical protein